LVSVVLTTYNRCQLLPRAINSVLNGTYENFEILVMDDASSDATPDAVSQFRDPRVRYLRMPENGGVLRLRNRGFDAARGDYVVILDDDDELLPEALAVVVEEFAGTARENVGVLWFDCRDAESGQKSGTMPIPAGTIDFDEYVCGRIQGDFWIVFSKAALHGNRFNEKLKAHESLLWLRIHRHHKARHVPKMLCLKYREHGGPRLCDLDVRLRQLEHTTLALSQFIEEFGDDVKRACPSVYGRRLAYLGLHQMATGDFTAGRASVLRSLRYRRSVKYALLYLASFFLASRHVVYIITRLDS
jgi:glycosyltransferase involved in cell wall biosynthesis